MTTPHAAESPDETRARITRFTDVFDYRNDDLSLTQEQTALQGMADDLLRRGPAVRTAESTGFDRYLYLRMAKQGLHGMALPAHAGGDGGSLVDAGLVAEAVGRQLAPVGFVESLVTARLLASAGETEQARSAVRGYVDGTGLTTFTLSDAALHTRQLVPSGSVADHIVLHRADRLLLAVVKDPPRAANTAALPLARLDKMIVPGDETELARGDTAATLVARALFEWRVLSAAVLTGLADGALALAVDFAKVRQTRGVPIGSLQAISHALADARIRVDVSRGLWQKAAWYADTEPGIRPFQDRLAFVSAARTATDVSTSAVHVHGGAGVTLESDVSLYFRRAKGYAGLAGDPQLQLAEIGQLVTGNGG